MTNWKPAVCVISEPVSQSSYTEGKVYLVRDSGVGLYKTYLDDNGSTTNGWAKRFFKLISFKDYIKQL